MSKALMCDACGEVLPLNSRGEHEGGEDAAWIRLTLASQTFDVCTRSCAVALLEREDVIAAHDAYTEVITGIATIRDERERADDD